MEWIVQIVSHTPVWVWVLFAFLVSRGIKAFKPAEVTPAKLAIVPVLLAGWGLYDLVRLYGVGVGSLGPWLIALVVGAALGWLILRGRPIGADPARGVILRPADYSVLPLVLIAFGIKYCFGVIAAISPQTVADPGFRLLDLGLSGFLAGIFVGKFATYIQRYLAASARGKA